METRACRICGLDKQLHQFPKCEKVCRICRAAQTRQWRNENPAKPMLRSARSRAKAKGLDFNLLEEDIQIPDKCPILGIPIIMKPYTPGQDGCAWHNSPSLDRIDNNKGYIKGNVVVISHKANTMKSNGSIEDLERLLEWLKKVTKRSDKVEIRPGNGVKCCRRITK